jgi:hypothetical protein
MSHQDCMAADLPHRSVDFHDFLNNRVEENHIDLVTATLLIIVLIQGLLHHVYQYILLVRDPSVLVLPLFASVAEYYLVLVQSEIFHAYLEGSGGYYFDLFKEYRLLICVLKPVQNRTTNLMDPHLSDVLEVVEVIMRCVDKSFQDEDKMPVVGNLKEVGW